MAALATASVLVTTACTSGSDDPTPAPPTSSAAATPPAPEQITFGVVGPREVQRAFAATVDAWNLDPDNVDAELVTWRSTEAMRRAVEGGDPLPDVFMASSKDLRWLLDNEYIQPVDELLDERGVEFGDDYSRDAMTAFSADAHLQCMPYAVAPEVIYFNKRLVNLERMANRGLNAPGPEATSWTFDQFAAAAEFASRPARGTKGVYVAPTLEGLAPFIASGGGSVFNDQDDPTSLSFASDASRGALERTLELLRNPQFTLDETQVAQAAPLEWFKRGKLGMIAGDRSLTPELRRVPDLDFDVLPMPRLDSSSTVGDVTGLCLSATAPAPSLAADLMVHEISAEAVEIVTRTGYVQPANVQVALSDEFVQPGRRPERASVFTSTVRNMQVAPMIDTLPELERAVAPQLRQLLYGVGVLDLDAVTTEIDEESRTVLDPESVSESPEPSESAQP